MTTFVWLLVRVDYIFHTVTQTQTIRKMPTLLMMGREGDNATKAGTTGVKIGFYSSYAKARRAAIELRKNWNDSSHHDVEILKFRLAKRAIASKVPTELTWQGERPTSAQEMSQDSKFEKEELL